MGIIKMFKNNAIKSALGKLTEGDTGSTVIGAIAVSLLALNIDFDAIVQLLSGAPQPNSTGEVAKVIAGVVLGLWAWYTGKNKANAQVDNPKSDG
jgi:hypothetical protein